MINPARNPVASPPHGHTATRAALAPPKSSQNANFRTPHLAAARTPEPSRRPHPASYSFRSATTGLASAARIAWLAIVTQAISRATPPAATNIQPLSAM